MNKIAFLIPLQIEGGNSGNTQRISQILNYYSKNSKNKIDIFCDDYSLSSEFLDENIKCENYYRHVSKIKRKNQYYNQIDDWICPIFFENIKTIVKNENYDLVWCNYPFMSKYLDCFKSNRKIIDLHDNFLHRNQFMNDLSWFSCNSEELYKSFSRTDFVVSISNDEYVLNKSVFHNVKHVFIPFKPNINIEKKHTTLISKKVIKVGFIGSINSVNISAIKNVEFIAKKLPNITFLIAGDICQHVTSMSKNIILMGKIDNINDYYKNIDLTISPTFKSTGQKIKVTESIFNGVPSLLQRIQNQILLVIIF